MIELPVDLPAELVPLSWLIGFWEGSGVVDYRFDDGSVAQAEFGQRISFSHDGLPYLNYTSYTWLFPDEPGGEIRPLTSETGYWRLARPLDDGDAGPGLLPPTAGHTYVTAEDVERLRSPEDGGFDIEVQIVHPGSVNELYVGIVKGPRIDLMTDAVIRTRSSKEYAAATRLYGLVDGHLLWAWDIAAFGQDLRTHASARLAKAD